MKKFSFKKMVVYIITFTVLAQLLPLFPMGSAQAATPDTRVVDPSTMTDWQNYFGEKVLSTENAGGVWGDKSIFKTVEEFNAATEDGVGDYAFTMQSEENNFLVALSAIASEQTIEGYSSLPTDTVFVLDVSGSMSDNAMADMIDAANASIRRLLALNPANNRVGVIVYSGNRVAGKGVYGLNESATVLLPIGSYEGVGTKGNEIFLTYEDDAVSVAKGILPTGQTLPAKTSVGSTYIQAGMQLAVDLFSGVKDDVAVASGPQDGTVRIPVTVLMSDGAPTAATTAFQNIDNSTHGDGNASSSTTSFLTQLTCAWVKEEMEAIYHRSPLFYTIGFNTGGSANARAVLDPLNAEAPFGSYWSRYTSAMKNGNQTLEYSQDVTVPVVKGLERNYVDRYFPVSTDAELVQAFGKVVDQISIQSQYYPTLVEEGQHHLDGYITFNDELGLFMEVKDIKGLTVHGELYPGSAIVREIKKGTFGDIYAGNLSNLNNQGIAFLAAVEKRLGCSQAQAGAIVSQALRAGQLSYTDESNFSNFIGWYADEDGHFLGFWNGTDHSARPSNAVYANKSYGFMGKVGDNQSFEAADMLHISVQVRTHIDLQHQTVIYKIPATLIPTVNYTIDFDGEHLETGTNFRLGVEGAKEALRLLFEVGLRSDINPINVAEKIRQYEDETGESYPYQQNGSYYFYSNSWHEHSHKNQQIVDTHDATWLDFEPSYDNGRYYYAAHSPVYVKTAENTYQVTSVDPRNTGDTYYTRFTIFTTRDIGLSEAEMEHHYVPIDAQNIQLAQQDTDGTWYIPKGTVHRLLADSEGNDYHVVKVGEDPETAEKTHPSQTLDYSNHPSLVFMEDGVHCTACLGNNGRLTITPAQGIALSNTMEVSGLGEDIPFTFTVTLIPQEGGTLAESYPVYDAEGRFMEILPVDSQGTITYTLTPGQTVYIVDLPTGTGYTVEEVPAQGWKLLSSENASGIVQPYAYNNVIFLNGPDTVGNLILHKEINLGDAVGDTTYEKAFESEVYLEHDQSITQVAVNGQPTVVENGKLKTNILLKAGQTVVISGIPDGVDYRVVEVNLPAGWKAD
ncbi:MAG: VWA domain-containing protein, partial [Clostridia bacterium]|nr:VWA domain-containing protein [Clostridia bacterium]